MKHLRFVRIITLIIVSVFTAFWCQTAQAIPTTYAAADASVWDVAPINIGIHLTGYLLSDPNKQQIRLPINHNVEGGVYAEAMARSKIDRDLPNGKFKKGTILDVGDPANPKFGSVTAGPVAASSWGVSASSAAKIAASAEQGTQPGDILGYIATITLTPSATAWLPGLAVATALANTDPLILDPFVEPDVRGVLTAVLPEGLALEAWATDPTIESSSVHMIADVPTNLPADPTQGIPSNPSIFTLELGLNSGDSLPYVDLDSPFLVDGYISPGDFVEDSPGSGLFKLSHDVLLTFEFDIPGGTFGSPVGFIMDLEGDVRAEAYVVPEPSTLLLLVSGLAGVIGFGKKRLFRKA
jgi:PEP-CTERM motif-containing protein